jgi:antitoxin HicB
MKYHFKIHKEGTGFWAECLELQGCLTQGDDRKHLDEMMLEVLSLYLDEPETSTILFPMPDPSLKGRNIVEVPVQTSVAMAMVLRQSRVERRMTQRQVADKLGMKHIWQYQKLESGRFANPELKTLVKLKTLFPNLSVDAILR